MIEVGKVLPVITLGRLEFGQVETVKFDKLMHGHRAVIIGVPGAFTPICSERHVPDFVANAPALRREGFTFIGCICPNDPWVTDAWARTIDPENTITFLSDGNLDMGRRIGTLIKERAYFLGSRPPRYMLTLRSGVVDHLAIEPTLSELTCTLSQHVLLDA